MTKGDSKVKHDKKSAASSAPERKSTRKKKSVLQTDKGGAKEAEMKAPPSDVDVHEEQKPVPSKNKDGEIVFDDAPDFRPNLTPSEVLHLGSFGGTYFRPIHSAVTKQDYKDVHKEFPDDWFEGLNIKKITSSAYDIDVNRYKVKCGSDLVDWERSGWIAPIGKHKNSHCLLLAFCLFTRCALT